MREAFRARPLRPDAEMNRLALLAQAHDGSRDELVSECMGLVAYLARRCRRSLGEDAFGEASLALLEAIDSYDAHQGDFRTWAVFRMWCGLAKAVRLQRRYRTQLEGSGRTLSPSDLSPMPELITTALREGVLTQRQAEVAYLKATGEAPQVTMDRLAISRRTYYAEVKRALQALRSYL